MVAMGEQGYMAATKRILETASTIRQGIEGIPEICVLGDPLFVIAFASETLNIYAMKMGRRHRYRWW